MSTKIDGNVTDINCFQDGCYVDTDEHSYDIEDVIDDVLLRINSHDRLVDALKGLMPKDNKTASEHRIAVNEAEILLKELGHEI